MKIGVVCINLDGICGIDKSLLFAAGVDIASFISVSDSLDRIRGALKYVFAETDGVCVVYTKKSWSNLQKAMLMEFERSSVFVEAKIPYVIAKGFERISDGVYFDTVYEKPFVFIPNELQKTGDFDFLSKIFKGDVLKIGIFDKQIKDKRVVYSDEVETIMTAEFRELEVIKKIVGEDRIYTTNGKTPQEALFDILREKNTTVSFAESCTAGLISAHMADLPGSSNYFMGGCVTYSNEFKSRYLGVNSNTLNSFGAVSREVATQMAVGVLNNSKTDFSVAVTGIAGPTGGSKEKPVGLVYIAVATRGAVDVRKKIFSGNRKIIREKTARYALLLLREFILAQ